MSRSFAVSLVALAALGALAGCGGSAVEKPTTGTPSLAATPSAAATDGDGELVPTNLPTNVPDTIPDLTNTPKVPDVPRRPDEVFGADISWPQCPKGLGIPEKRTLGAPMPTKAADFVIIGLTNGPSFYPNPCLAGQKKWVADRHLMAAAYSVVSYPRPAELKTYGARGPFSTKNLAGRLANVGYAAALFNLDTLKRSGLKTPIIWIDVEPVPKFEWSSDLKANAAVVQGMARGYTDAGFEIGYYSTPALWRRVVGGFRMGSVEWRAAGQTSKAEALSRCGPDWSIQGGRALFGQWVEDGRDRNVTCPGVAATLGRWFHQY
ncbi:hypothetical protein ABIE44_001598 [Marmoricola sp. OAE513]|uniref:hypothetical protein n=1 Tax=Marmoricola sp. OAE513 TaxID=2817894 RepID=UPI001AE35BF2